MFFFYINRKYLHEITALINRKDIRAVRTWCRKNGVTIYTDAISEYVIQNDFDLAYDLPLIKKLKAEHGDTWQIIYQAYHEDKLHTMLDMDLNTIKNNSRYVPKGNIAKNTKT